MAEMHPSMRRLYEAAAALDKPITGQSELARAVDETPQNIKNWETRKTGVSQGGAAKVQRKLGISSSWVLVGQLPMQITDPPVASQSARQVRETIGLAVRVVAHVRDVALEVIPAEREDELFDVAIEESEAALASRVTPQVADVARRVAARFRTGG